MHVGYAGSGATGVWVLRPSGRMGARLPVVLFLHGWGAADPRFYGPWLAHLVRRGNAVIYPVYQQLPYLDTQDAFPDVIAGVRAALRAPVGAHLRRDRWVVAGHSAGGAFSADYAASAHRLGLPAARAVFAAYPGRQIRDIPVRLPTRPLGAIPPTTRLEVLYGARDTTVGDREAKRIARVAPGRVRLIRVGDPAVDTHRGPQASGPATRRVFWARLDALIRRVRR